MRGLKIFIQSFLIGVMRCGGMATRRVSDFRTVRAADAGKAGKAGAEPISIVEVGSTSISKSSSSVVWFDFKGGTSAISSSPSTCCDDVVQAMRAFFFLLILLRFLDADVLCSTCATTMFTNGVCE